MLLGVSLIETKVKAESRRAFSNNSVASSVPALTEQESQGKVGSRRGHSACPFRDLTSSVHHFESFISAVVV